MDSATPPISAKTEAPSAAVVVASVAVADASRASAVSKTDEEIPSALSPSLAVAPVTRDVVVSLVTFAWKSPPLAELPSNLPNSTSRLALFPRSSMLMALSLGSNTFAPVYKDVPPSVAPPTPQAIEPAEALDASFRLWGTGVGLGFGFG